ncbi:MAG: phosphotransferase [Planctomycetes bacterium]|nr:phosphotransferase [Planctomycetota bacterium]
MPADLHSPWPLEADDLKQFLASAAEGADFRESLEELLCSLPLQRAEHLMLLLRHSRAAWLPLLRTRRGRALFIGNAFSGAGAGLALLGWEVVLRDESSSRLAFADARARGLKLPMQTELSDGERRLPHPDESFDLVVSERAVSVSAAELARVSRGEVVLVADNRYAYKRSTGVHGEFEVRRPGEYLKSLFSGEGKSLAEHSAELQRAGLVGLRPHALYPDSRDFTFCVSLGDSGPSLPLGPKERSNRLKMLAKGLGLFPHLTPSYALIAHKPRARLERPLSELLITEALGAGGSAAHELEHLVNTRASNALLLSEGARPLALHVPMESYQKRHMKRHLAALSELRDEFPWLPVPRSCGAIMMDGIWYTAEERLEGLTAGQICGDPRRVERMLRDVSLHLSKMTTRPATTFTERDCERLVGERVRRVVEKAKETSTIAALREMEWRAREALVGEVFPLVRSHGDLRSKHVQVDTQGGVLGYLDWGSTVEQDLPMFDLLHLIIHERKQESGVTPGEAWRLLEDSDGGLRPHERAALDSYASALELPARVVTAVERIYPLLVADVAERSWDYSRPDWVHRFFGI